MQPPDAEHAANVLVVKVTQARGLKAMDSAMFGKGSSDPFATLKCGGRVEKTKVIKKTLAPVWNEEFRLELPETTDGELVGTVPQAFGRADGVEAPPSTVPTAATEEPFTRVVSPATGAAAAEPRSSPRAALSEAESAPMIDGFAVLSLISPPETADCTSVRAS